MYYWLEMKNLSGQSNANAYRNALYIEWGYVYYFGIGVSICMGWVKVVHLYVSWPDLVLLELQEGSHNKDGRARHSAWRNYDDLNEFFW